MREEFQYDVFLSHNAKDKPRVRLLAERLKAAGMRVWFDEWNVHSGDISAQKVDEGLEQSRVLLLCISPDALASGWVALERSTAVHRDPSNSNRRFIPLLLGDCELPDTLRRYKYVDFREEADEAFEEVLKACQPEVIEVPPQTPEEKARPTFVERLLGKKSAQKKQPAKKQEPKAERPEQVEPLAVLERKLTGHEGWVDSVAVSPDGKWAASGAHDKTVKIWDIETGECRATLKGHTQTVWAVAITPNGKWIVSGSEDASVRVWAVESGRELARLDGHATYVRSLVVLSDGNRVLSGQDQPPKGQDLIQGEVMLKLWDLDSRSCIRTIQCGTAGEDGVFCTAVDQAGKKSLSGHRGGQIRIWDLETGECLATLDGHLGIVHSVQITGRTRFAVSGSGDSTIKVWDLNQICVGTGRPSS
jgi:WD40 repeat protein